MHVGVIGAGKVGMSIAMAYRSHHIPTWVVARRDVQADVPVIASLRDRPFLPSALIIAVPDTQYAAVAHDVASAFGAELEGMLVVHTSGRLVADVLQPCADRGARIAAIHPFQTFATADPHVVQSIGWGIECQDVDAVRCIDLVAPFNGAVHRLPYGELDAKLQYHAAAVAASNLLYASLSLARELGVASDLDNEAFLLPILRQTLANASSSMERGTEFGVTGPLIRGDVDALEQQQRALPPSLKRRYQLLHLALLDAVQSRLDASTVEALHRILDITP